MFDTADVINWFAFLFDLCAKIIIFGFVPLFFTWIVYTELRKKRRN